MHSSLNAVISTNESTPIITSHLIYDPAAYTYLQIPTENHPYPINDDPKGEKAEQKGGEGCQTPCKSQTNVLNCNVIEHLFIL